MRILPQLVFLDLTLDPSEFNPSMDISSARKLVLALHEGYLKFQFSLSFGVFDYCDAEVQEEMRNDSEILGCVSESFRIKINGVDLVAAN